MAKFRFSTVIEADTHEQALQVMSERMEHDEDYGFFYRLFWCEDPFTTVGVGEGGYAPDDLIG